MEIFRSLTVSSIVFVMSFSFVATANNIYFGKQHGDRYMGDISGAPTFQWASSFSMKSEDSKESYRLQIMRGTAPREAAGVADEMQPSGPANRNIVTDVEYSIIVYDQKGEMKFAKDFSPSIQKFINELNEKAESGKAKDDRSAHSAVDFFETNLETNLVSWAKSEFSVTLESTGRSKF